MPTIRDIADSYESSSLLSTRDNNLRRIRIAAEAGQPKKATLGDIIIGLIGLAIPVTIVYCLSVAVISSVKMDKKLKEAGLPTGYSTYSESPKSDVSPQEH